MLTFCIANVRSLNWSCHEDKSFSSNSLRMQKGKMDGWLTKRRQKIKSVHSALRSAGSNISHLCWDQCVWLAFCGFCIRVAEWWFSSDTLEASWSHFVLVFTRCTNLQHLAVNLRDMFDFLLIFYTFSSAIRLHSTPAEATHPFLFPPATGGRNPRGNEFQCVQKTIWCLWYLVFWNGIIFKFRLFFWYCGLKGKNAVSAPWDFPTNPSDDCFQSRPFVSAAIAQRLIFSQAVLIGTADHHFAMPPLLNNSPQTATRTFVSVIYSARASSVLTTTVDGRCRWEN